MGNVKKGLIKKPLIILTGSTGLLGKHLKNRFLELGYKLLCPIRSQPASDPTPSEALQYISYQDLFHLALDNNDRSIIVHCAGLVSYEKRDKQALFDTNKGLTKELGTWALKQKVDKFIYVSSISTLGRTTKEQLVTENMERDRSLFITNYGLSKLAGEEAIKELSNSGLDYIILNPSVIIGPSELHRSSLSLFKYVIDQKPFYTKGLINYIDIRDLSNAIEKLIESQIRNEQYIINGGYIDYGQFFATIAKYLNLKAPSIRVPLYLVRIGAILENSYSKLIRKSPTLSIETAKMAGKAYIYSAEKFNKDFNMPYHSLNESIEFTTKKLQELGEIKEKGI